LSWGPSHATALLTLLCAAALPDVFTNLATMSLRVRGKLGWAAALNLGMAGLALGLAWIWLPQFGIIGGGWAWLAAQSAGSVAVLLPVPGSAWRTRRAGDAVAWWGTGMGSDDGRG
jgi:O-antigen/teichoic acid export membrane protein